MPLLALLLFAAAGAAVVAGGGLRRADVLLRGGNPLASAFADRHVDQPYPESPLAVALRLEAAYVEVDEPAALAFADALAEELGWWLLTTTGASDVHAAEEALWAGPGPDAFATRWAVALQEREVYARKAKRLSEGIAAQGFVYVHPDELVLLLAHVAWRLDLRTELVRSPVHHYLMWREPGGDRVRGIEATCFRRVDATGAFVDSEEPSVGRRLHIPEDRYPSGAGGIRNPDPLPPGAYETVTADALEQDLVARLELRHGEWRRALQDGLAAWEAGDDEALARAAEIASASWREAYPPEHLVLQAAVTGDVSGLRPVFEHHEPDGPVLLAAVTCTPWRCGSTCGPAPWAPWTGTPGSSRS